MLPDPPHKIGYFTKKPNHKSFVTWNDVNKYQERMTNLNLYLEKQEDFCQKNHYKKELDRLLQIKAEKKRLSGRSLDFNLLKKNKQAIEEYEKKQKQYLFQVQQNNLKSSFKNKLDKENQMKNYINQQNDMQRNQIEENQKMAYQKNKQKQREKFLNGKLMKNQFDNYYKQQQESSLQKKQKDFQYSQNEKQNIEQMMNKNKEFYEKIKARMISPAMEELYRKVVNDEKAKQDEIDFFFHNKTMLKKLQKELDEEKFEIERRMKLKDDNLDFLNKQIKNNELKKELLGFEQQRLEHLQLQNEIQNQKIQDQKFKETYKQKLNENLDYLKKQIEEKRAQLLNDEHLTIHEAKHNNLTTQLVDFENPSKDLVCGLPGFARPYDRVKQLEMIKQSSQKSENLLNYTNHQTHKRTFSKFRTKQKELKEPVFQAPKTQDEIVKQKMTQRPFNIISNTINYN